MTLSTMTEQRYSISLDELEAGVRVPAAEQVEVQAEPHQPAPDMSAGVHPYWDDMAGDADGN
jgi:hypothetical protein